MSGARRPRGPERAEAERNRRLRTYRLFGVTLGTAEPLRTKLSVAEAGPPDVVFRRVAAPPGVPEGAPVFESPVLLDSGESFLRLYRCPAGDLLRFTEVSDWLLTGDRMDVHLLDPEYEFALEIQLMGAVLSYWLERRGTPVLHASAVRVDGSALAFLATNRGGKTSLAATLMQSGAPLVTDDLLCVRDSGTGTATYDGETRVAREPLAIPGYPQMRMWPDLARHFLGSADGLDKVHPRLEKRRVPVGPTGFGSFSREPARLARLYLPERREGGSVEIEPLSPRDAVVELVRATFLPRITFAAGLQADRMKRFVRIAERVPMRRLRFPEGLDDLPRVREAVLSDLPRAEDR